MLEALDDEITPESDTSGHGLPDISLETYKRFTVHGHGLQFRDAPSHMNYM